MVINQRDNLRLMLLVKVFTLCKLCSSKPDAFNLSVMEGCLNKLVKSGLIKRKKR